MKKTIEERLLAGPLASIEPVSSMAVGLAASSAAAAQRWEVVRHTRLPHRNGLPLSSGGGDAVER